VVSFFEFLRWTAMLNIFNAFFVLMLIIIPQLAEDKKGEAEQEFHSCDIFVKEDNNNTLWFPVNDSFRYIFNRLKKY
jgi:hypothetical protein